MSFHREVADDELSSQIIGAAISIHKELGPDLEEEHYRDILAHTLCEDGLEAQTEVEAPIIYEGQRFGERYVDLVVNDEIALELKSVNQLSDGHFRQLGTNVRLLDVSRGLLLNFGSSRVRIRRYVNGYGQDDAAE